MTARSSHSLVDTPLTLPELLYRSATMHQVAREIYRASQSHLPVLITGETGTGKELVARAIHQLSPLAAAPFVPYNCAAITPSLSHAELFGFRKGAFTDATYTAEGVIRAAHKGTLFLDEIGDLPLEIQPKLLRFLDSGEVHPLGETRARIVKVRLIIATNADLRALMQTGRFREDLYYRLAVLAIPLPPLRERRADIPLLVEHFLRESSTSEPSLRLAPAAVTRLLQYDYPGNVRELRNIAQQLVAYYPQQRLLSDKELLQCYPALAHHQPSTSQAVDLAALLPAHFPTNLSLAEIRTALERKMIQEALWRHAGNLTHAAQDLGWERNTLRRKIKTHCV